MHHVTLSPALHSTQLEQPTLDFRDSEYLSADESSVIFDLF